MRSKAMDGLDILKLLPKAGGTTWRVNALKMRWSWPRMETNAAVFKRLYSNGYIMIHQNFKEVLRGAC